MSNELPPFESKEISPSDGMDQVPLLTLVLSLVSTPFVHQRPRILYS